MDKNQQMGSLQKRILRTVQWVSVVPGCIALMVLFGWIAGIYPLVQVLPNFVAMQFNTALCFFMLSASIFCSSRSLRVAASILSALVFAIAAASFLQYITGLNFGLDEFFLKHEVTTKASHPGRMAPNTALDFMLLSLGVFSLWVNLRTRIRFWTALLAAFAFPIALVALVGYALNVRLAYGWFNLTHMALHTAFCFTVLSILVYLLSWSYREDGHVSRWVIMPIGLAALFLLFSFLQLFDVIWATYSGLTQHYYLLLLLAFLAFVFTIIGIQVFKKSVFYIRKLEQFLAEQTIANKERGMLLYYLNEEVRAPLFAIIGYMEMLLMRSPDNIVRDAFAASQRVRHVLDDLVVVMQLSESGPISLKHEASPEELYTSILSIFKIKAESFQVQFASTIEGNMPKKCHFDREKLYHVIAILLHHALSSVGQGGSVLLTFSFYDNKMRTIVTERGNLINEKQKEAILSANPFKEGNKIDRMQLGFYVCHLILRCLDSQLNVARRPEGTEFSFVITL